MWDEEEEFSALFVTNSIRMMRIKGETKENTRNPIRNLIKRESPIYIYGYDRRDAREREKKRENDVGIAFLVDDQIGLLSFILIVIKQNTSIG